MANSKPAVGIRWISKRQLGRVLNSRAQRVLGVSGDELKRRLSNGEFSLEGKEGTVELATLCSFTGEKKSARSNRKRSR